MSKYLYRLARLAFRRRRLVLAAWLLAAIAAIAGAQLSGGKTNDTFTIPGTEAQNAATVLQAKLPAFSGGQSTIVFATNGGAKVTDPADQAAIESAMAKLKSIPQVLAVTTPFQSHLVSPSGQIALGQVQWSAPATGVKDSSLAAVKAAMKPVQADGVQVAYNGSVYPGWRTVISEVPELIGLIIAFGILMITFGAFVAAGMPILGAIIGVVTTLMGITAVAAAVALASASPTVALRLGLSCGIDYGLFILSRHRANLLNGMTPEESVPLAAGTAGSSVVFAALTVIIALCGLTVVGIPFLTVMGLAAAASVTVALLIALTLLPAMLGFAGTKVAKFARLPLLGARAERVARRSAADPDSTAGAGWARFVVHHRVPVLLGGIALLGVLAIPAASIHLGLPSGASQSADNTQRKAYDLTTEGFGAGYNGALLIVAQGVRSAADTQQIAGALGTLPDVAQVAPLAAHGAQVAMFQWGWGEHLFGITPAQTISFLPIIMLAIIFGLSSDYEVFVVSRIKEEYTRNGDARRAVQRGTALSARVVTAAAMIMFSIFVALMFTSDPTIKAIGFSFAVGVFLDAFVVRLTLVPAVMAIIGSRIWYHPQWFARTIPNPDIEGQRLEDQLTQGELAAAGASARER